MCPSMSQSDQRVHGIPTENGWDPTWVTLYLFSTVLTGQYLPDVHGAIFI